MNFGDLFIDAGIVIAVITAVSAYLTARVNRNTDHNYNELKKQLDAHETLIRENNIMSVRTDLYHALSSSPGDVADIMAIAKVYFIDLQGDSYISRPMARWAFRHKIDISSLYADTNDLRQQMVAIYRALYGQTSADQSASDSAEVGGKQTVQQPISRSRENDNMLKSAGQFERQLRANATEIYGEAEKQASKKPQAEQEVAIYLPHTRASRGEGGGVAGGAEPASEAKRATTATRPQTEGERRRSVGTSERSAGGLSMNGGSPVVHRPPSEAIINCGAESGRKGATPEARPLPKDNFAHRQTRAGERSGDPSATAPPHFPYLEKRPLNTIKQRKEQ